MRHFCAIAIIGGLLATGVPFVPGIPTGGAYSVVAQRGGTNFDDPATLKLAVNCRQGDGEGEDVWIGPEGPSRMHMRARGVAMFAPSNNLRLVIGVLTNAVDLADDDDAAKSILNRATRLTEEKCRLERSSDPWDIRVQVHHGDPLTFDERTLEHPNRKAYEVADRLPRFIGAFPLVAVSGVARLSRDASVGPSLQFRNGDTARRDDAAAAMKREAEKVAELTREEAARKARESQEAAQRAQQEAQLAQQRAQLARQKESEQLARQKEQREAQARSNAFAASTGVKNFVSASELGANPFVFQGRVVGLCAIFTEMQSATDGLFLASGSTSILFVSSIPAGRFTKPQSVVVLAGQVVGKQEIKLPLLGAMSVPHLAFVGSAPSEKRNCGDYAAAPK